MYAAYNSDPTDSSAAITTPTHNASASCDIGLLPARVDLNGEGQNGTSCARPIVTLAERWTATELATLTEHNRKKDRCTAHELQLSRDNPSSPRVHAEGSELQVKQ